MANNNMRVIIIDNKSTHPDLLDWYNTGDVEVIKAPYNLGYKVFWELGIKPNERFILSDPDVYPIKETTDILDKMHDTLDRWPIYRKVGAALYLDDVTDSDVIEWESQFWTKPLDKEVYEAWVDTTFAMYHPWAADKHVIGPAMRLAGQYQFRHLSWYGKGPDDNIYWKTALKGTTHWTDRNL